MSHNEKRERESDPFGIGDESPGERLARRNMEDDLHFLHWLADAAKDQGATSEDVERFAAIDDPRLSDIRRLAHAAKLRVHHEFYRSRIVNPKPRGGDPSFGQKIRMSEVIYDHWMREDLKDPEQTDE